jgi:putative SOS response-associated peptidase YedK
MISHIKWGLIPSWSKDDSIKKYTLNARHETVNQKPSFKNAKRCLIFADGFYEWKWLDAKGTKKQKYLIEYPDSELFAFAGLYDQWVDKETGEIIRSCSILTTQAKGIMREIHNSKLRMPVTINKSNFNEWLDRNEMNILHDFKSTIC